MPPDRVVTDVGHLEHFPFRTFAELQAALERGTANLYATPNHAFQWAMATGRIRTKVTYQSLSLVPFWALLLLLAIGLWRKPLLCIPLTLGWGLVTFLIRPGSVPRFRRIGVAGFWLVAIGMTWVDATAAVALGVCGLAIERAHYHLYRLLAEEMLDAVASRESVLCRLWQAGWFSLDMSDGETYHRLGRGVGRSFKPYADTSSEQLFASVMRNPLVPLVGHPTEPAAFTKLPIESSPEDVPLETVDESDLLEPGVTPPTHNNSSQDPTIPVISAVDAPARLVAGVRRHLTPGEQCDALEGGSGRFGYASTNPIPGDEAEYCQRLRCPEQHAFWFHRLASVGAVSPDGHIVDVLELLCFGRECRVQLYFDMYHRATSGRAPEGMSLGEPLGVGTTRGPVDPFPGTFLPN